MRPEEITILIGNDAPDVHLPSDTRWRNQDEPLAVNTVFGWTLFGKGTRKKPGTKKTASVNHVSVLSTPAHASDKRMDDTLIPRLWENRNFP